MEKKTYKAKVELIRQGQDGKQMYVLEKGQVAVSKVMTIEFSSFFQHKETSNFINFLLLGHRRKRKTACV